MSNRLFKYATFGDTGLQDKPGRLKPYQAQWEKDGTKFFITVWALNDEDARAHCDQFVLRLRGKIIIGP